MAHLMQCLRFMKHSINGTQPCLHHHHHHHNHYPRLSVPGMVAIPHSILLHSNRTSPPRHGDRMLERESSWGWRHTLSTHHPSLLPWLEDCASWSWYSDAVSSFLTHYADPPTDYNWPGRWNISTATTMPLEEMGLKHKQLSGCYPLKVQLNGFLIS